jgi:hypothetical protein
MTSYNTVLRRSMRWYRKLAIELLTGTAVVNAWAVFNQIKLKKDRGCHRIQRMSSHVTRHRKSK